MAIKETLEVTVKKEEIKSEKQQLNVGLIMPIAEIAGLNESHWEEVRDIIRQSLSGIDEYKMNIRLVSHSDEVRVIQTSIVQNIYFDDIVIIDVSAKNANVMFEFGMRLAFDKAFVVVKDDVTPYIFDTGNIQHLEYPRDLRHSKIEQFKVELRQKVLSTLRYVKENPNESMYLEQYGNLKPSKIDEKEVSETEYFQKTLETIRKDIKRLENNLISTNNPKQESKRFFKIIIDNSEELYSLVIPIVEKFINDKKVNIKNLYFKSLLNEYVINELAINNIGYSPYLLREVMERCFEEVKEKYSL